MTRHSTRIRRGVSLSSFTCDACWDTFSTYEDDSEAAARREGWVLVGGYSMGGREYCPRCA